MSNLVVAAAVASIVAAAIVMRRKMSSRVAPIASDLPVGRRAARSDLHRHATDPRGADAGRSGDSDREILLPDRYARDRISGFSFSRTEPQSTPVEAFLDSRSDSLLTVISVLTQQYPQVVTALRADIFNVRMKEALSATRSALDPYARLALPTTMAFQVLEDFVYESSSGTLLRNSISVLAQLEGGATPQRRRPSICDRAQADVEAVLRQLRVEKHDLRYYSEYLDLMRQASSLAYYFLRDEADCRVARAIYFVALCKDDWRKEETRAWMAKHWPDASR
jgi:hypothetical protein